MRKLNLPSLLLPIACCVALASAQTTRPSLEDFDRGFQQLYRDVHQSVVHVLVPIQLGPHPLQKWIPDLDPKLREQLEQPRENGGVLRVYIEKPDTTTQPLEGFRGNLPPGGIILSPRRFMQAEFTGLILDNEGDVVLPLFVDKQLVGDSDLRVTYGDNQVPRGKLLGSDQQTNIAVVKLEQPVGQPIRMAQESPAMGSLVLLLSPIRGQMRLGMWTGGQEEHAVVMNSSGALAGFMRYGHMLEPYAFGPVTKQLIETGKVKRAKLGVLILELGPSDPARTAYPTLLGSRPAARVDTVNADSAAERAGLRKDDLILSLAGDPVNDLAHFAAALSTRDGPTDLRILRDGHELILKVDLQRQ